MNVFESILSFGSAIFTFGAATMQYAAVKREIARKRLKKESKTRENGLPRKHKSRSR